MKSLQGGTTEEKRKRTTALWQDPEYRDKLIKAQKSVGLRNYTQTDDYWSQFKAKKNG